MVQRTVLKVRLSCEKCRTKILKSVSDLNGVDKIEIDVVKDTLTVTGDADPYAVIIRARKVIKCAEVVTVGPPPKKPEEKKPDEKKPEEKKSDEKKPEEKKPEEKKPVICVPPPCVTSRPVVIVHEMTHDPCTTCSIM